MNNQTIIKNWKIGFSVKQISKKYMEQYNKKYKKRITLLEAQKYVEPIIYKYQTGLMKGE